MFIHWQPLLRKALLIQVDSYNFCDSHLSWYVIVITCYAIAVTWINLFHKFNNTIDKEVLSTKNALREVNENLENKVAERTIELQNKIHLLKQENNYRQQLEAHYQSLLDAAPQCIYIKNLAGKITL
ncbi:MAG: hypothetical protein KME64_09670 [Scytonematopsis contorta HA4267-MV1]|jgi:C4-dicarboxylate-specific signal transduction histidine kinase|nr:hypothetical protein [Scytonematopsis contorta HA4267-MV1]